jgi:hypothetical protein
MEYFACVSKLPSLTCYIGNDICFLFLFFPSFNSLGVSTLIKELEISFYLFWVTCLKNYKKWVIFQVIQVLLKEFKATWIILYIIFIFIFSMENLQSFNIYIFYVKKNYFFSVGFEIFSYIYFMFTRKKIKVF